MSSDRPAWASVSRCPSRMALLRRPLTTIRKATSTTTTVSVAGGEIQSATPS